MSVSPVWAKVRVIGEESIEYARRIGRLALPHGQQIEVDLVRRDDFAVIADPDSRDGWKHQQPRRADDGTPVDDGPTLAERPMVTGEPQVRLAGIRLGLADAELVGAWVRTAVELAHSPIRPRGEGSPDAGG